MGVTDKHLKDLGFTLVEKGADRFIKSQKAKRNIKDILDIAKIFANGKKMPRKRPHKKRK